VVLERVGNVNFVVFVGTTIDVIKVISRRILVCCYSLRSTREANIDYTCGGGRGRERIGLAPLSGYREPLRRLLV